MRHLTALLPSLITALTDQVAVAALYMAADEFVIFAVFECYLQLSSGDDFMPSQQSQQSQQRQSNSRPNRNA